MFLLGARHCTQPHCLPQWSLVAQIQHRPSVCAREALIPRHRKVLHGFIRKVLDQRGRKGVGRGIFYTTLCLTMKIQCCPFKINFIAVAAAKIKILKTLQVRITNRRTQTLLSEDTVISGLHTTRSLEVFVGSVGGGVQSDESKDGK